LFLRHGFEEMPHNRTDKTSAGNDGMAEELLDCLENIDKDIGRAGALRPKNYENLSQK
jgi:hypothetical protein